MVNNKYKEVYFDQYCTTCKNYVKPETDDKCDECLNDPARLYSHKPINWEGKNND